LEARASLLFSAGEADRFRVARLLDIPEQSQLAAGSGLAADTPACPPAVGPTTELPGEHQKHPVDAASHQREREREYVRTSESGRPFIEESRSRTSVEPYVCKDVRSCVDAADSFG
jgi:hypothetical protein